MHHPDRPSTPSAILPRERLERWLDEGLERRLTTVVAGAGFGKTTLLASWAERHNAAWYTATPRDGELGSIAKGLLDALRLRVPGLPSDLLVAGQGPRGPDADADQVARADAYAALLAAALRERLARRLVLVLDDLHELEATPPPVRLVAGLVRQAPPGLSVVAVSRRELPFPIQRLRGRGEVLEIPAGALAFTVEETRDLLAMVLGEAAAELGERLHAVTRGWPAATRLAVEALRRAPADEQDEVLARMREPGGPLFGYLAEEVFEWETPEVREVLRMAAHLEWLTPELLLHLGALGAPDIVASLDRRGLFLEPYGSEHRAWAVIPLIGRFVLEAAPMGEAERAGLHREAASWFADHRHWKEALTHLTASGDPTGVAGLLEERGREILAAGAAQAIIEAAELLDPPARSPVIDELEGEARQVRGDWEGALACFQRVMPARGAVSAGIAWRAGLIHHLRGELEEALALYDRGRLEGAGSTDEALLLAWKAAAFWLRGDREACAGHARRALEAAQASGAEGALAAAHTVLAMLAALEGDRVANQAHYLRALDHARRAGDVLQTIRIHVNRSSHHLEEGYYQEAVGELEVALRLADLAGFASFRALALTNRGEAYLHMGRLDEAVTDLEAGRAVYERFGSRMAAYPLAHLGDVHRERGNLALARALYEQAVGLGEVSGDLQGMVPALAGLARITAPEDPEAARSLAERAVACGPVLGHVRALVAAGWVELEAGDPQAALGWAEQAAALARSRRDRAGLAEVLELEAAAGAQGAPHRLEEALAVWRELGNRLGEARVKLARARAGEGPEAIALAREAELALRGIGARRQAEEAAGLLDLLERRARPPVEVHTLGGLRLVRGGRTVPVTEWQSKKARDLLKILVARRGRPVHREFLLEALWPDEDPAKTPNRLSVALSVLRSVFDPDRSLPQDRFIVADRTAVALAPGSLWVDLDAFLEEAEAGLSLWRGKRVGEARPRLAAAEAAYVGDFLEEDPYEDWAVAPREEARSAYLAVAGALAEDAASEADHEAAGRYYLRILERDPYDERAHLGLVACFDAAGRHGEARRLYRQYSARMEEIGVEAAPFPAG